LQGFDAEEKAIQVGRFDCIRVALIMKVKKFILKTFEFED
jgi:hypothetical protein